MRSRKHQTQPRRRSRQASGDKSPSGGDRQKPSLFYRNRTLIGSLSSNVGGAAEKDGQLQSPRVKAHHLVDKRRHLGVILAAVLLVSVVLFALVSQFTADVVVDIKGLPASETTGRYAKIIDQYFSRRPVERLRFMTDQSTFTAYIQSKAPEIESAEMVGLAGFAKSQVVLTARRPVTVWDIGDSRQYVDASGISFKINYYDPPKVQIVDRSGIPSEAGQLVASNRFLSFVGQVVGLVQARGYDVTEVIIPEGTTRQIQLKLKGSGFPIKYSVDRPAGEQVEDMDRAVRYLKSKGITPEYIDVRVSGRAYYR